MIKVTYAEGEAETFRDANKATLTGEGTLRLEQVDGTMLHHWVASFPLTALRKWEPVNDDDAS